MHNIPHLITSSKLIDPMNFSEASVMAALASLHQTHLTHLAGSISGEFHHHHRRLISLLSAPIIFTLTLKRLQSLSLHHKSLLVAHYLLSNLNILHHFIRKTAGAGAPPPISTAARMKLRDLDAVLLLLLLCEIHHYRPKLLSARPELWRDIAIEYLIDSTLSPSSTFRGFRTTAHEALIQYVDCVGRCWNFVKASGFGSGGEVAAAVRAVVGLPSVEVIDGGGECVICKEEMEKGRVVCELPCNHRFHWLCALRWFEKSNTCPCCRHPLPSDDVRREIRRLLEDFKKIGQVFS